MDRGAHALAIVELLHCLQGLIVDERWMDGRLGFGNS